MVSNKEVWNRGLNTTLNYMEFAVFFPFSLVWALEILFYQDIQHRILSRKTPLLASIRKFLEIFCHVPKSSMLGQSSANDRRTSVVFGHSYLKTSYYLLLPGTQGSISNVFWLDYGSWVLDTRSVYSEFCHHHICILACRDLGTTSRHAHVKYHHSSNLKWQG